MNYGTLFLSLFAFLVGSALALAGAHRPVGGRTEVAGDRRVVGQPAPDLRESVIREARRWVGVREASGKNDGPEVDAILDTVGLKGTRAPYCAAFNATVYSRAGVGGDWPRSAWSPAWVVRPTWTRAHGGKLPLPGDAFGIWFTSKNRVAHTGLVEQWETAVVLTIEANTAPDAAPGSETDRDGDGVWRKRRHIRQIYSVRDWIDTP